MLGTPTFTTCNLQGIRFLPSTVSRGTWRAIRDHVQRSYLIVREAEPDQLCVPASRRNCWTSNPVESLFFVFHNVIDTENLNSSIDDCSVRANFRDTYFLAASISHFTWLILLQCIACCFWVFFGFSVFPTWSVANPPCSCQYTFLWCRIYTNKHTGWRSIALHHRREVFGSASSFFLSFCFARFKVLSEQMLLLNLSKCVCVCLSVCLSVLLYLIGKIKYINTARCRRNRSGHATSQPPSSLETALEGQAPLPKQSLMAEKSVAWIKLHPMSLICFPDTSFIFPLSMFLSASDSNAKVPKHSVTSIRQSSRLWSAPCTCKVMPGTTPPHVKSNGRQ